MQNKFSDMGIIPDILKAIEEMGFVEPTEVQDQAIPIILDNKDVIVMSKTGSGKTAVFGIPMLQIIQPENPGPQGLILTPTRELAVQIDNDLKLISKYLPHQTAVVYGQHSMNVEVQALKKGAAIVTGTPGRVFDHLQQGNLVTKNIRFLVLDEADRMLDMGFYGQVIRIVKALPKNRITLLFSATIPLEVQRISRDFMNNPAMIEIESPTMTVDSIRQIYYRLNRNEKQTQLNRILLMEQPESCMIFCNTRIAVDHVQTFLSRKGYAAQSLHGDIPQAKRMKTIEQFKEGTFHILVATDVAARGLHIDNLSLVINYDVPLENDGYVHRIGRTGRAGNEGLAITMVTGDDIMSLYEIEEHTGAMIEETELPTDEMLESRKDTLDQWIQANAIKFSPDSSDSDAVHTNAGNTRSKSGSASRSRSGPAVRSRPDSVATRVSSGSKSRQKPGPGDANPGVKASVKAQMEENRDKNPIRQNNRTAEKPIRSSVGAVQDKGAATSASTSGKSLKTLAKPHVRIVGGAPEESDLPSTGKTARPVSAVPVSAAPASTSPTTSAPASAMSGSPAAVGKDSPEKVPAIKKIFSRLFKK